MTLFQFLVHAKRLTGVGMAVLADILGVTAGYLGSILSGKRPLSDAVARRAARYFHLSVDALNGRITELDARQLAKGEWMRRAR